MHTGVMWLRATALLTVDVGVPRRQPHRRSGLATLPPRGSYPLVTPYYCRLGDLLCFVFIVSLLYFFC